MRSDKVKKLKQLSKIVAHHKKEGRKVGLITGCFDILHIGHIRLFQFAKKHVDIVIVGLDNDKSIQLTKGKHRPIHNYKIRSEVLNELSSVDYIFQLGISVKFGLEKLDNYHAKIIKILKPDYIITNPVVDGYWRQKKKRANDFGIKLLKDSRKRESSSTSIIDKLLSKEF